jgi:hypothetical protein
MSEEPTHTYDLSKIEVFEAGAAIVSLLAYPAARQGNKRHKLHTGLCALAVRTLYPLDSASALQPQPIKPIYAFRTEHEINRDLRTLHRRLRDRMIAGRMALAFLQDSQGIKPKLPGSASRLPINALSELVADDAGYTEAENVETRIWRPSLPVIHLAAAIQVFLQLGPGIHIGHLIADRPMIEWVISAAEEYEGLFTRSRYRGISASKLIKVRLGRN